MWNILTIFGWITGYFAGIYKERSNIKWKEKREALKDTYTYLQNLSQSLLLDNVFTKDFAEKTETFLGSVSPILSDKFNKQLKDLIELMQKYLIRVGLVTDISKQDVITKIYLLMENIQKELQ